MWKGSMVEEEESEIGGHCRTVVRDEKFDLKVREGDDRTLDAEVDVENCFLCKVDA